MMWTSTTGHRRLRHLLLCAVLLALAGCSVPFVSGPSGVHTPTASAPGSGGVLHPGTLDTSSPPAGWRRILNGERFTGRTGDQGLVASAAQPGRLAGCALPAEALTGVPVFVLSGDGGHTWRAYRIPGAPSSDECAVFTDTQQADTFMVDAIGFTSAFYFTLDAGVTWHSLVVPASTSLRPYSLVAGHLLATALGIGTGVWHLQETIIGASGNSVWQQIDSNLPDLHFPQYGPDYVNEPQAIATAPDDPARIYLVTVTDAGVMQVYATSDEGQSWQLLYQLPTAKRVKLWTALDHRVYVEDLDDRDTPSYQFYYSPDAGAHWLGIGMHLRTGGEDVWVSPGGRVITRVGVSATEDNVFTLDPTTGSFTMLDAKTALGGGAYMGVVVDGPAPSFIYGTARDTYAFPLP